MIHYKNLKKYCRRKGIHKTVKKQQQNRSVIQLCSAWYILHSLLYQHQEFFIAEKPLSLKKFFKEFSTGQVIWDQAWALAANCWASESQSHTVTWTIQGSMEGSTATENNLSTLQSFFECFTTNHGFVIVY